MVLTERGPTMIKNIIEGQNVISMWIKGSEIDDPEDFLAWRAKDLPDAFDPAEVLKVNRNTADDFIRINGTLKATPEHPFMVNRDGEWRWLTAEDLKPGDAFKTHSGKSLKVKTAERIKERLNIVLFDVISPYDNFLVAVDGDWVLVHNRKITDPPDCP